MKGIQDEGPSLPGQMADRRALGEEGREKGSGSRRDMYHRDCEKVPFARAPSQLSLGLRANGREPAATLGPPLAKRFPHAGTAMGVSRRCWCW